MRIPKHYQLVEEHPHAYTLIDTRDGKNFQIAKNALDLESHGKLSKIKRYADGGTVEGPSIMEQAGAPGSPDMQEVKIDTPPSLEQVSQSTLPEMQSPEVPDTQEIPQVEDLNAFQKQRAQEISSLEDQKQAIEEGVKAEGSLGNKSAKSYGDYADKLESLPTALDIHNKHLVENENLRKAYADTTLDPDHYWHNKSFGEKIGAAIGVFLSGGGSGGNGQGIQIIRQKMKEDLDAQKEDRSKKMNLYKMNLESTHNEQKATIDTQLQLLHATQAKILKYTAQSAGAMAKKNAVPLMLDLNSQIAAKTAQKSLLAGAGEGGTIKADPSILVPSMIPPQHQAAAYKEIEEMKNLKSLKDSMLQSYDQINRMFSKGLFSPADRASAINSFAGRLVKLSEGSFTKEQAEQFAESYFPNRFESKETSQNKLDRLNKMFNSLEKGSVFNQSGLRLDQFESTKFSEPKQDQQRQKHLEILRRYGNSKDPKAVKVVTAIKKKYGIK